MKIASPVTLTFSVLLAASIAATANAQESPTMLTLGAKLHAGGWTGENKGANSGDIESESGSGAGLSLGLRKGAWSGVLSIESGSYDFEDEQPNYDPEFIVTDELTINSSFISLGVGYQLNPYFSMQGGIKSHAQEWDDFGREIVYVGIGVGFTGYYPINDNWTLYATLGLNGLTIEDEDGDEIGDGGSSSLEVGAAARLSPVSSLSFGFRSESVTAEFDSGNEQEHTIGNFYLGYNHAFEL